MNNMLLKKPSFWIITGLFVVITVGMIVYVFPPLFGHFNQLRSDTQKLVAEQQKQQQYTDLLSALAKNKDIVTTLYQSADQALPTTVKADFLLIQLDTMISSMGLSGIKLVVPFNQGITSTPASTGSGSSSNSSRGTATNNTSQPIVRSETSGSLTTFSISGPINFSAVQTLIQNLRNLSRWNKITALELSLTGDTPSTSITAQVFTMPSLTTTFTGADNNFLTKAQALFGAAKSYTTQPDSTTEGTYGRANPFAPVK